MNFFPSSFSKLRLTDLKYPFTGKEGKPYLHNQVMFLPDHMREFNREDLPVLTECFDKAQPLFIEYCSGNGSWIIEKALNNPHCNWVAVEYEFERVRKIWLKREKRALKNLVIISGEALLYTKNFILQDSIEGCYVNFPDPWPKRRHAKHRLIQKPFIDEISRILKDEGFAHFVTDDPPYFEQMNQEMSLYFLGRQSEENTDWQDYGSSYFKELWLSKGLTIHHLHFIKERHA